MLTEIPSIKGMKRSRRDPAKFRALLRRIRKAFTADGRFKGKTESEILEMLRQTREEVWAETKDAAGTR